MTRENGIPSLQNVFSHISQAEAITSTSTGSSETLYSDISAFYSSVGRALPPRGRGGSRGRGKPRCCTHCQRTKHTMDRCWELHNKPAWAPSFLSRSSPYMFDSTGSQGILSSPPAPQTSSIGPATAKGLVLLNREEYDSLLNKMQATMISDVATLTYSGISCLASFLFISWIIDSVASTHITVNLYCFLCLLYLLPHLSLFAESSSKFISGTGTGTVHHISSSSNVHQIHGVPFNLLYVSHLIKSLNCSVIFSPIFCVL